MEVADAVGVGLNLVVTCIRCRTRRTLDLVFEVEQAPATVMPARKTTWDPERSDTDGQGLKVSASL